ncbi:hypothetical protein K461DRAFT_326457 [Myriangium duriaei CBS 260.36]|uniref:LIM zinc-binding domain-containing protein n=1 Tax=Myriangium duriaei CBS 260.36 TaxID=1168546 RepID=A0A9P4J659_9PEZI|nr:hypothetical protein K461DRAFT_326457 [Myriangium duriaei CBS 260.36]
MLARARLDKTEAQEAGNFMSDGQLADYLADLRTSRVARLKGSRPAPPSRYTSLRNTEAPEAPQGPFANQLGRPLVPEPLRITASVEGKEIDASQVPGNLSTSPSVIYLEDGTRQTERQEAHALRVALEGLDLEEERRVHDAAQAEASQLVLEHTSPTKKAKESAFANPDIKSQDRRVQMKQGIIPDLQRIGNSNAHSNDPSTTITAAACQTLNEGENNISMKDGMQAAITTNNSLASDRSARVSRKKSYQGLANAVATDIANIKSRVSSGGRRIVSGGKRKVSSEKHPFPNREDKIYEEPEIIKEEETPVKEISTDSMQKPTLAVDMPSIADMPRHLRKNPFARVRLNKDNLERANSIASVQSTKFDPIEIQKNPPTQSRRPWYMSNKPSSAPVTPQMTPNIADKASEIEVEAKTKDGLEIRGDDIRAATSMRRKDRNPNLPQPTAVSVSPGRPIVSFQNDWQKNETKREETKIPTRGTTSSAPPNVQSGSQEPRPRMSFDRPLVASAHSQHRGVPPLDVKRQQQDRNRPPPATTIPNGIPILNLPDDDDGSSSKVLSEEPDIPQINILQYDADVRSKSAPAAVSKPPASSPPSINVDNFDTDQTAARPLPMPNKDHQHRQNNHAQDHHGSVNKPHLTPYQKRNAVLCAHCALPIAGRILTAAGERFHPECFACHQCGINLECVAFYPEPDKKYYERIARIQQRMQGFEIAVPEGVTEHDIRRLEQEDGDESLRFFCHLDFHELFSPRCRSCKTPIEGEVVVACGAEWHVGHFFCAQCGDVSLPFQ